MRCFLEEILEAEQMNLLQGKTDQLNKIISWVETVEAAEFQKTITITGINLRPVNYPAEYKLVGNIIIVLPLIKSVRLAPYVLLAPSSSMCFISIFEEARKNKLIEPNKFITNIESTKSKKCSAWSTCQYIFETIISKHNCSWIAVIVWTK